MKGLKKLLSKTDKPLLFITMAFFIFGLIMIFSASNISGIINFNNPYHFLIKQVIFLAVGLVPFLVLLAIPTRNYRHFIGLFMIIVTILLLGLLGYGAVTRDTNRWYYFAGFSLQPSEFAKVLVIIYMAIYYEKHLKNCITSWFILLKPLIVAGTSFVLVMLQPDLGTAVIIGLSIGFVFLALPIRTAKKRLTIFGVVSGVALLCVILFIGGENRLANKVLTPTQIDRFSFQNPCDRYELPTGYQVCNSFIAFNQGGLLGAGLGNSTQKYMYLPEAHNDFIFPIIVEELGTVAGIIVLLTYMFILYRIIRISKKATTLRGSMMSYGVAIYILSHIFINFLGIMGLGPMTGVPLPFLSYGGSFTLSLIIALSIVQRIAIETKITEKKNLMN